MLLLIAPSKTQSFTDTLHTDLTQPVFLQESQLLIRELQKVSVSQLSELMKMSDRLAVQTHQQINDFELPFTVKNGRTAMSVFQGDVYSKIAVTEYDKEELDYLQSHLRILSGLYGILRPLDLMQMYRLEMGCRFANQRGDTLYKFWGDIITEELNTTLLRHKEPVLINLASKEYSRVIRKKILHGTMLQIDFKERKGNTYRTVAIHAKRARGMMVNFAVKNRVLHSTELKHFQQDRYRFNEEFSTEEQYCFTRN